VEPIDTDAPELARLYQESEGRLPVISCTFMNLRGRLGVLSHREGQGFDSPQLHTRSEPLYRDLHKRCGVLVQQQSTAAAHPLRLSPNRFNAERVAFEDAWA
jgi:hypothetical protein